jgi:hypothetical protein
LRVRSSADAFLARLGAGELAHPGGTLLAHLRRTADLLDAWGGDEDVVLAGLCHAAYGTTGFPIALLDIGEREQLRAVVGERAEHLVRIYCACDRQATYPRLGQVPLCLTDRFAGKDVGLDAADASGFAGITMANEVDIVLAGGASAAEVATLVRDSAVHAPGLARRALDALSLEA